MGNDFQSEVPSSLICALSSPYANSLNPSGNIHLGWPNSGLASVPGQAQVLLLEWYKDILSIMEIKVKPCFQKPVKTSKVTTGRLSV